jgi:hypothetical protein
MSTEIVSSILPPAIISIWAVFRDRLTAQFNASVRPFKELFLTLPPELDEQLRAVALKERMPLS